MGVSVGSEQVGIDVLMRGKRPWGQILQTFGVLIAVALFIGLFYKQTFVGLTDRNAMDLFAQIARNVASGQGFTTHVVRPFNVALINDQESQTRELNTGPAFPCAVAALFKLRAPCDQVVAWVSMLFCLLCVVSTYLLGKLIFNRRVGLLAACSFGISASVLKAAGSGTEWTMAAFLFAAMLAAITVHHRSTLVKSRFVGSACAFACAVLLAMLYMTNHILLLLVIPLAIYFAVTGERRKLHLIVFAVAAMLAVAPWAYRNVTCAGGSVLGANAWDIMSHTSAFPGDAIYQVDQRSKPERFQGFAFPD